MEYEDASRSRSKYVGNADGQLTNEKPGEGAMWVCIGSLTMEVYSAVKKKFELYTRSQTIRSR